MAFYETLSKLMDENNVKAKNLSEQLGIGKNQFKYWKDNGNIPNGETLILLADYFNCSVDYLLGRVDTPNGTYSITGDNNVQINGNKGNNFTVNSGEQPKKENRQNNITENFIKVFETLDFTDQVEAMKFVTDMTKK